METTRTQPRTDQGRSITRRPSYLPTGAGGELFNMSPFTLLNLMTEQMDRIFAGNTGERGYGGAGLSRWNPPFEIRQREGNLIVSADVPGVDKNDVRVEVQDDVLVIEGERRREQDQNETGQQQHHGGWQSERSYGYFYRAIRLPDGAKADQARAEFRNGVLEVTIPLSEDARQQRKQIPIQDASGTSSSSAASGSSGQQGSSAQQRSSR